MLYYCLNKIVRKTNELAGKLVNKTNMKHKKRAYFEKKDLLVTAALIVYVVSSIGLSTLMFIPLIYVKGFLKGQLSIIHPRLLFLGQDISRSNPLFTRTCMFALIMVILTFFSLIITAVIYRWGSYDSFIACLPLAILPLSMEYKLILDYTRGFMFFIRSFPRAYQIPYGYIIFEPPSILRNITDYISIWVYVAGTASIVFAAIITGLRYRNANISLKRVAPPIFLYMVMLVGIVVIGSIPLTISSPSVSARIYSSGETIYLPIHNMFGDDGTIQIDNSVLIYHTGDVEHIVKLEPQIVDDMYVFKIPRNLVIERTMRGFPSMVLLKITFTDYGPGYRGYGKITAPLSVPVIKPCFKATISRATYEYYLVVKTCLPYPVNMTIVYISGNRIAGVQEKTFVRECRVPLPGDIDRVRLLIKYKYLGRNHIYGIELSVPSLNSK